jgi:hypothetical protein
MLQHRSLEPVILTPPERQDFLHTAHSTGLPESAFEVELLPVPKRFTPDDGLTNMIYAVTRVRVTRTRTGKTRTYPYDGGDWLYWATQDLKNGVFG